MLSSETNVYKLGGCLILDPKKLPWNPNEDS